VTFTVRRLTWGELQHLNPIDVGETGYVVLAWVDGEFVADPQEWERPSWDAELWLQRLAGWWLMLKPDVTVGAFDGEELVGLASLRYRLQPDMAQLTTLHVGRAHRRQGVATLLLAEVVRLARENGAARLYVSAVPTPSAIGFYARHGFQPAEEPDPEMLAMEPDEIHMVREI
jgi:GNAT superfamily N-acetyltransferase